MSGKGAPIEKATPDLIGQWVECINVSDLAANTWDIARIADVHGDYLIVTWLTAAQMSASYRPDRFAILPESEQRRMNEKYRMPRCDSPTSRKGGE